MSEDDQKLEYVNALEEARKLDSLLASLSQKLNKIGSNLVELGKGLQGLLWQQVSLPQPLDLVARNFSRELYERNYAVPDLLEQYKEAYAKRTELEERLRKFSWYTQVKADQPQA